jgi:hypothetical protein
MKKKSERITMFLLLVILFSSCSPLKVTLSSGNSIPIDKIAVVSTFLRMDKPVVPLLDAAVMNEKTNSIAAPINTTFEENIDIMRDSVANILQKELKCEVFYGEKLHGIPGFNELKAKYNFDYALDTKDSNFPQIISANNDINPFDFKDQRIEEYFKTASNYAKTIAVFTKAIDVSYVAVSLTLIKPSPGSLFIPATLYLVNYIYVFDKNGNCIASGRNSLPPVSYKPNEPEGYQEVLDTYSATVNPIIVKIAAKYRNK